MDDKHIDIKTLRNNSKRQNRHGATERLAMESESHFIYNLYLYERSKIQDARARTVDYVHTRIPDPDPRPALNLLTGDEKVRSRAANQFHGDYVDQRLHYRRFTDVYNRSINSTTGL